MGLRPFLLRGLEKIRTEWRWACTGGNLRKLILEVGRRRAKLAELSAEEVNGRTWGIPAVPSFQLSSA
ncbi:MAG TPA: hypothetical protein PLF81_01845 [Candidatus Anammoximicrobium sp.]|nr:hypothetical protein [Candidatus Anammoximicrobium sp.]